MKKILLLAVSGFYCVVCLAQASKNSSLPGKYRAIQWTTREGLSHPDNNSILKDINGFIWIGSAEGLNRFDGNSFKYYFSENNGANTIVGDDIYGIKEDSLHNIWLGSGNGLSRYDIRADTFTNFISTAGPFTKDHLITPFGCSRNEVFCMDYNEYAIMAYDIHSFARRKVVTLTTADSLGFRSMKFQYSYFDEVENNLWLLTETSKGGLLQISLRDGKRTYHFWPVFKTKRKANTYIVAEAMKYDSNKKCLWINTPEGLMKFDMADRQFHTIEALNSYQHQANYDRLVGIDLDPKGRVWFATQPTGIIIYDPADGSVELPFPNDSAMQFNTSMFNACLYCDRDGTIWTGSWLKTGVYQLAPFSRSATHYQVTPGKNSLSSNTVYRFTQADSGKVWIGTEDGINIFNPDKETFQVIRRQDVFGLEKTADQKMEPVSFDSVSGKATLIAGGLYVMDIASRKSKPVVFKDSSGQIIDPASFKFIFSLKLKNGCISKLSYGEKEGIFFMDGDSVVANELVSYPIEFASPFIQVIADRFIFVSLNNESRGHLTYIYEGGRLIPTPTPLDNTEWNEIEFSKTDRSFWVAARRQLLHYTEKFRLIKVYTPKDGLPPIYISSLTTDDEGNLWFHTDRSIHQLNTETGIFSTISEKDGFEKMDFLNYPGSLKSEHGELYFPTGYVAQGFVKINPEKFNSPPSSVYIESIEVNQQPISLGEGANSIERLNLRYFENKINISTGIIDYFSKGKSRIRYKLEGRDTNWQYSTYYSTIRYEGLPSGRHYTLLIQASNAANDFNSPIKRLSIYIRPAFWETWWFRIGSAILTIAVVYGLVRWRLQQRFRTQLEKSEKEIEIAEIKQKAAELEMQALRAQMNPHFIFNSLNSINRFILQNNRNQASEYLTKFSKLVRMILQNSQSPLITLESELESLGLYLEMECLRFDYHFDYKINVPPDLDIEILKVPPLILQPYVENAIWHGLMHKEEKGLLDIDISQQGEHLFFRIKDNGIGRKKASELASKSATKHKSMGLRITANRIAMMQRISGDESPVKIADLVDAAGVAAGTVVTIQMPVIETE